ncbi:uncharacterized protein LOC135093958 [Scylla paramamosain]|uniref:uncharacterized protein LOC135093958 n=1 Tax=Scylla paramamosain TaxID=85552 RepID=UPI003083C308
MPLCCVPQCATQCGDHQFPQEAGMRKLWEVAIKREKWSPTAASRVCHKHFTGEDYVTTTGRSGNGYRIILSNNVFLKFNQRGRVRPDQAVDYHPQGPPQYGASLASITPLAREPQSFGTDTESLFPYPHRIPLIKAMNPLGFWQEKHCRAPSGLSSRKRHHDYCSPS